MIREVEPETRADNDDQERWTIKPASAVCSIPECGKSLEKRKGGRGLCVYCYQLAIHLIKTGQTTWGELEKLKLSLPLDRKKPPERFNLVERQLALARARAATQESQDNNPESEVGG